MIKRTGIALTALFLAGCSQDVTRFERTGPASFPERDNRVVVITQDGAQPTAIGKRYPTVPGPYGQGEDYEHDPRQDAYTRTPTYGSYYDRSRDIYRPVRRPTEQELQSVGCMIPPHIARDVRSGRIEYHCPQGTLRQLEYFNGPAAGPQCSYQGRNQSFHVFVCNEFGRPYDKRYGPRY